MRTHPSYFALIFAYPLSDACHTGYNLTASGFLHIALAVKDVSAVAVNSSSLHVRWSPVMGGMVIGYNVTYTKVNRGQPLHKAVFQISVAGAYITNLPGMTTYNIKVGLMRDGGETIWSEEVLAATLPRGR